MATRRAIAGAFSGAQDLLGGLIQSIFQDQFINAPREARQEAAALRTRQHQAALQDPMRADQLGFPELLPDVEDLGSAKMQEQLTFNDPLDFPSESAYARQNELDFSNLFGGVGGLMGPPSGDPTEAQTILANLGESLDERRAFAKNEQLGDETIAIPRMSDEGVAETFYASPRELRGQSFAQERTGAQEGQRTADRLTEGELSPEVTEAMGAQQARVGEMTLPTDVQRAGQVGYAQANAQYRAQLANSPALLEYERARAMASQMPTEGEQRTAANLPVMAVAHETAKEYEARGVGIGTFALTVLQSPMADAVNSALKKMSVVSGLNQFSVSDNEKLYTAAAIDFTNVIGFMRSGVTVREDEFDRFIMNFFATASDGPVERAAKQQRREILLNALQATVGASGEEYGQRLGMLVEADVIPEEAQEAFQFTNTPDGDAIRRGFYAIRGQPEAINPDVGVP